MSWGRSSTPSFIDKLTALSMLLFCPIIALIFFVANYGKYHGSLQNLFIDLKEMNFTEINQSLPKINFKVLFFCIGWVLFQFLLAFFPDLIGLVIKCYKGGIQKGHTTPAGNVLLYNINGLQSWLISHITFIMLCYFELINPTIIIDNLGSIFISANIIGYCVTIFAYTKALNFPSHREDNKLTDCFFYDLVMGIEFNPRVFNIDLKLFFNGRPGIIAWTLINLSFLLAQYKNFGYVTDSMILVNILQCIYVLDFFWNENWYLHTIDIAHDHFGWILSWADCVWLPFLYTLQAGYLMNNPIKLGNLLFTLILIFGLIGYLIFRIANYQKDTFRNSKSNKNYKFIQCKYTTNDGIIHHSKLLCSGLWGYARHLNYTGDIILSMAYCLSCGLNNVLPYFYCIFMLILLFTRCIRDEDRCQKKYSNNWNQYCKTVPYRFIPYIL